ncbi:MAG: TolC family protein, partial [Guyparkeria sp.]|uniref:TolC family protein n=1 Tax=Guyparkeria sp. TaxID=2035736 RepID=UPI00397A160D
MACSTTPLLSSRVSTRSASPRGGRSPACRPRLLPATIALALSMGSLTLAGPTPAAEDPVDFTANTQAESRQALALPFNEAVERTLNQNAAVDISQARIDEARAAIEQANGNLLPTLDLSFGVTGSNNPLNVFGMKLQQEQANFNDFGAGEFFQAAGQDFSNLDNALQTEPDNLNDPGWHHNVQTSLKLSVPVYNGGKIR